MEVIAALLGYTLGLIFGSVIGVSIYYIWFYS